MSDPEIDYINNAYNYVRPAKVCLCKSVTRQQIIESIQRGHHTLESIAQDTLATTGCGTCKPQVKKILEETLTT